MQKLFLPLNNFEIDTLPIFDYFKKNKFLEKMLSFNIDEKHLALPKGELLIDLPFNDLKEKCMIIAKKNNIPNIWGTRFFVTHPQCKGIPHIDCYHGNLDTYRQWSLNVPVNPALPSYHEWFDVKPNANRSSRFSGIYFDNLDDCVLIDRYELTRSSIVNTAVPHAINNCSDQYRVILAVRPIVNYTSINDLILL